MTIGPTGRPYHGFPTPAEARRPRSRPHHLAVQPEGRRRQDDDDHQPGRRARRVRPQGARGRLRPAGRAVGRPRHPDPRRPDDLRPAARHASATRTRSIVQTARRGPRHHPGEHRPVGRRGAPRQRGRARDDPRARAAQGHRRLRRHPDRLPALARPAHRQRAHREPRRASSRSSASSSPCAASRCSSRRSTRCATGSTRRSSSTACSRRCTTRARCTRARCSSASSRRSATTCSRPSSAAR